jgi:hypothetical protein
LVKYSKAIYIGNVVFDPQSTRDKPYLFGKFQDARDVARITGHSLFAVFPGDPSVYRFWPGGRIEEWPGGDMKKSFERTKDEQE